MKFRERKQIVLNETEKLYAKYKEKGLISIYWYGSGLEEKDFKKGSDIDLIGISKNKLDIKYEKEMILELQKNKKLDIRIRILYLSELNGNKTKSLLAKVLPVKLLLMDFKNYIHLQGEKFKESEFKIKKASFKEASKIEVKIYLEKRKEFLKNDKLSMYLVKAALYYFYYKSCEKKSFKFSYSDLSKKVLKEYKGVVGKLTRIKNYNVKDTKEILVELDGLILHK